LPPDLETAGGLARGRAVGPPPLPGRRVCSMCLECSVRLPGQERTGTPPTTWKITASWWI